MLLASLSVPKAFEALMILCFGISWPFSILRVVRTKRTEGKSAIFISLVLIGYLSGIAWKILTATFQDAPVEPITLLYVLNALLVGIDLVLLFRYRSRAQAVEVRE